jgi:adenylosuccinate lyase
VIPRYDYHPISAIWSDNNRYLLWTNIELAFLEAFRGVRVEPLDVFYDGWVKKIQGKEQTLKHDVAAFVEWLEHEYLYAKIKTESRFVHYGLTSSDILDTAFSLQIRDSNAHIVKLVDDVSTILGDLALRYRDITIIGRTHGQAAETIHLSDKFSAYRSALEMFAPLVNEAYYGRLRGSVGDQKYFDKAIELQALEKLGLEPCPVNDGQIMHRALFSRYMNTWATLGSTIGKIATDIRLLAQTEIGELQEGFSKNQIGSSSMPHKHNPIFAENLCGLARVIRGYQTAAMQNIELWNERDISHSSSERIIFPDAVTTLGFMLHRLKDVLFSMRVNTDRMAENIEKYGVGMESQKKMLKLINQGSTRKEAHALMRAEIRTGRRK